MEVVQGDTITVHPYTGRPLGGIYLIPELDPNTGLLPAEPQFHDASTADVKERFVDCFPCSITRPAIFAAYLSHTGAWVPMVGQAPREQWLDGSFTTAKPDPGDVDFVTFVPEAALTSLAHNERVVLSELFAGPDKAPGDRCHAFLVPIAQEGSPEMAITERQRAYWQRWFGRQRPEDGGNRKGIVRLRVGGTS